MILLIKYKKPANIILGVTCARCLSELEEELTEVPAFLAPMLQGLIKPTGLEMDLPGSWLCGDCNG